MICIEQVSSAVVWPVRHEVMYPHEPFESIQLPEDAAGLHLALFEEEVLVSVISLFRNGDELQFRKFATLAGWQGRGYGTLLLQHVLRYAKEQGVTSVWCNARGSATGFYKRFGLEETGEAFLKGGIKYVIMELKIPTGF